jgi:hypothetical protein
MPTPAVVRRRRAIKAGLGLLVLSLLAAMIARFYLRYIAPPSPGANRHVAQGFPR